MRIEPLPPHSVIPNDQPAPTESQPPASLPSDHVQLSRLSQALTGEAVSDARLEELRAQVAEGGYEVPASDLSQRIVDALLSGEE